MFVLRFQYYKLYDAVGKVSTIYSDDLHSIPGRSDTLYPVGLGVERQLVILRNNILYYGNSGTASLIPGYNP